MEIKQPRPGAPAHAVGLELADKQISALVQRFLPPMPHLLSVPTRNPYLPNFPHENLNTPFEDDEVKHLQYMTFLSNGDRGVGVAQGNWLEEVQNGKSPWSAGARSSTTTPNPFKDSKKPAVKMSIADYKNLKQSGVKPSPRPAASATPETRPKFGHSRNTSAISTDTPMARVPSLDGGEVKLNGVAAKVDSGKVEQKAPVKQLEKPVPPHSSTPEIKDKARPATNGHIEQHRESLNPKESSTNPRPASKVNHLPPSKEPMKHPLPPRPQSPQRSNLGVISHKRPLESGDTQPEKRAKIEHSRTPSNSQKTIPRSTPTETKPSPSKLQKSQTPSQASPQPKKVLSTTKIETKQNSKSADSEKPLNIPPLLSPLPADLDHSPATHSSFSSIKKAEPHKNYAPSTPSKSSKIASDTIVVKSKSSKNETPQSSPLTTPPESSPPFVLPRLLSPDLPDIVEQELLRLQEKSKSVNTVEARHEKARQPGAPGVAQKTVRPKIGHPPKPQKNHGESSKAHDEKKESIEKQSLIVKLLYKKRNAKNIERILGIKARPDKEFKRLEAERLNRASSSSAPLKAVSEDSDSSVDVPLSKISATKQRPSDSSTSTAEPAPKRTKLPDSLDVSKAQKPNSPAFKSPALSNPAPKNLLSTPSRKGDAMKSVAMRKVDSSDGHARTPLTTSTSTPASAEKPRLNGTSAITSAPNPELDKLRLEEKKYTELALKLKREMDRLLQLKTGNPDDKLSVSESDRKLGLSVGLESIAAYMHAFHFNDRANVLRGRRVPNEWESLLKLWEFVDREAKVDEILRAVSALIGVMCREILGRIFVDGVGKERDANGKVFERMIANAKKRDEGWREANRGRKALGELGIGDSEAVIGPWSSVKEVTEEVLDVLGRYARRERLGWKRDAEF